MISQVPTRKSKGSRYVSSEMLEKTYLAVSHLINTRPIRPSLEEIAEWTGYQTASVHYAVKELIKLGVISKMRGVSRSIQILKPFPKSNNGSK